MHGQSIQLSKLTAQGWELGRLSVFLLTSEFSGTFIHLKKYIRHLLDTCYVLDPVGAATNQRWPQFFQSSESGAEERWTGNEISCVIVVEGAQVAQSRSMLTRLGNCRGKTREDDG